MKIYRRSLSKITSDMDILQFIKLQRIHNASLYGLMSSNQKKFSKVLSLPILSEFSSDSDDGSPRKKGKTS